MEVSESESKTILKGFHQDNINVILPIKAYYDIINKEVNQGKVIFVPTISMFYGIIIRMYCTPSEHNPPHFHAYYQEYKAIVDIGSCEITNGHLPVKQAKLVTAWA